MPASDPALAALVLDLLHLSGEEYALLQADSSVYGPSHRLSDLDVVVGRNPIDVLDSIESGLRGRGLRVTFLAVYDAGGVAALIHSDQGGGAVQLDLLHDPFAKGINRIYTDRLIAAACDQTPWRTLAPVDAALWEVWRGLRKHDLDRLQAALAHARSFPSEHLTSRARDLFHPRALVLMLRLLSGSARVRSKLAYADVEYALGWLRRIHFRIRHPTGSWLAVEASGTEPSSQALEALAESLSRTLIRCDYRPAPRWRLAMPLWWVRRIASARIRHGVVITPTTRRFPGLAPDLVMSLPIRLTQDELANAPCPSTSPVAHVGAVINALADGLDRSAARAYLFD